MTDKIGNIPKHSEERSSIGWRGRMKRLAVALVIIIFGIAVAVYLIKSAPKASKRPPDKQVPVVETVVLQPTSYTVFVNAMGTVFPAHQVVLKSRVAGQVLSVHPEFVEGGLLKKGAETIQLDDTDYKLILAQRKSNVVNSQYALKLEIGRQDVAKREWKLLKDNITRSESESELALRKPHLDKAKADLAAAEATVEKAILDLNRTRIISPLNAIVRSRFVNIGSQVSPQEPLAELVGTDIYWIKASIPVGRLEWIQIPKFAGEKGAYTKIYYARGQTISGTVSRLTGDIGAEERMAKILVEVRDPLNLRGDQDNRLPLLIGEYVRLEIEGRTLEKVFKIPRTALRDNDAIWLATSDMTLGMTLDIRKVTPIWKDSMAVVLQDGLNSGDQLIVSDLPAPVTGMKIRLEQSQSSVKNPGVKNQIIKNSGTNKSGKE